MLNSGTHEKEQKYSIKPRGEVVQDYEAANDRIIGGYAPNCVLCEERHAITQQKVKGESSNVV